MTTVAAGGAEPVSSFYFLGFALQPQQAAIDFNPK